MKAWIALVLSIGVGVSVMAEVGWGNESTTIVMHAHELGSSLSCDSWVGEFDCSAQSEPRVNVGAFEFWIVFAFLRNYEEVSSFTYEFKVDNGDPQNPWGDWDVVGSNADCLPNQLGITAPSGSDGHLITSFECITGGELAPLVKIWLTSGSSGCLIVEDSQLVISGIYECDGGTAFNIPESNRARICVGDGGYSACNPAAVPVRAQTWGAIKEHYRR